MSSLTVRVLLSVCVSSMCIGVPVHAQWNTWIHRLSTTLAPSKTRTGDRAGLLEEGDSTDGSTSSGSGSGAGSAGSYGGSSSGSGGGYSDGDESA